jgi:predicted RNA-binding Zn-ribbon protein involved in translation (DUF1610 family)
MRIPWLAREYERKCDECGFTWRVPRWAVHPPTQGLPIASRFSVGSPDGVVAANAELAEEVAVFRRCPECASAHYKQRPIRS